MLLATVNGVPLICAHFAPYFRVFACAFRLQNWVVTSTQSAIFPCSSRYWWRVQFSLNCTIKRKISKWNKTATIRATPVDYERNRPFSTDTFCINYFAGQTHVTECKRVNEVNCYPKNGVKRFKRLWTQFHNFINDTAIYLWYWHDELISFQWARCVCLDVHQRVPNCCCWTVKK